MRTVKLHKLFVYGTLKLHDEDTHWVSGKMWDVGYFPCVKLNEDGEVPGQLLDVTDRDLEKLDRYEGVPRMYTREKTTAVSYDSGEGQEVYIYEWAGETEGLREIGRWTN